MMILFCFGTYLLSLVLVGLYFIGHLSFKSDESKKKTNNKLKIPSFNHF